MCRAAVLPKIFRSSCEVEQKTKITIREIVVNSCTWETSRSDKNSRTIVQYEQVKLFKYEKIYVEELIMRRIIDHVNVN